MGNWQVVDQIVDYIPSIDFDKAKGEVSLFETTIRYLGGLISGKRAIPALLPRTGF